MPTDKPGKHSLTEQQQQYLISVREVIDYAIILLSTDGIIQNWNRGAEQIKGYAAGEAIGKHFEMFYSQEDRASGLPARMLEEAAREGHYTLEGWRVRKDHSIFWASVTITAFHDDRGDIAGYLKVTRDLTSKKLAEDQLKAYAEELRKQNEALRESKERYHKMVSEVQDYAILSLDTEGNIQNWNAGAERIKGYANEEIVGKNFRIFYSPADQARRLPEALIEQARTEGKAIHEGWRVRKDGSVFWGSVVITALHGDSGEVIGYSKVTRDLTERKAAEEQSLGYMRQLEARNGELEQFAYIASHDLQEPLRKIRTFADLIDLNLGDETTARRYLNKTRESATRMSALIKSVLNYSRLIHPGEDFVLTDVNTIVAETLVDFELLIESTRAVFDVGRLPVLTASAPQIQQLFSNLIGNALKFNRTSPVISIHSRQVEAGQISDSPIPLAAAHYHEIVVSDNGIGFEEKYKDFIFSMFRRLHSRQEFEGTGLGLALCRRIMERHDGFIKAESELSKSATFYLYFPATPGEVLPTA